MSDVDYQHVPLPGGGAATRLWRVRRGGPGLLIHLPLLLLSLTIGCASGDSIPPQGGPPDKEAPLLEETSPVSGTVNFSDDRVELDFNESINPNDVRDQVIITPIPLRSPTISVSGSTVRIDFEGDLIPDRTYAITVGAGLRDLSGNRLGSPVTLRFATGPTIDSGRIAGSVRFSGNRPPFVFAWQITDDPASRDVVNRPPDFIAPASDNGTFQLEGLPGGTYRVAAVDDVRRDRTIDPGDDAVGVGPDSIVIAEGSAYEGRIEITLPPAAPDLRAPSLYTASGLGTTRTLLRFSEPIDTTGLELSAFRLEQNGNTINTRALWRPHDAYSALQIEHAPLSGSGLVTVTTTGLRDTVGNRLVDSTRVAAFTPVDRADTSGPQAQLLLSRPDGLSMGDTLRVLLDEGVKLLKGNNLMTGRDSTGAILTRYRLKQISNNVLLAIPEDATSLRLNELRLQFKVEAVEDLQGNRGWRKVDTTVAIITVPQLGTLSGSVIDSLYPSTPHVIILRNALGVEYRIDIPGAGPWSIEDIPSDAYQLEAFRDNDRDGELDYGTLSPWLQGERSVRYSGGIRVRPRWTTTDVDVRF